MQTGQKMDSIERKPQHMGERHTYTVGREEMGQGRKKKDMKEKNQRKERKLKERRT